MSNFLARNKMLGDGTKEHRRKVWKGCEAIAVDAKKVAGGIGILWNPREVSLSDFSASRHSLSAAFHILGTSIRGFMTNVDGPPRAE